MTSKKKLKKINRKLMAEHLAISGENEALNQENQAILDGWSTYQSTHPDLTGVVNCLITIAEQGEERNSLIRRNIESGERAEKKMEAWEESLKDDTAPPDLTDIQREAVERDYLDSEAQFEQNLALMLHRAEDEGDNHCVIMGSESDGNIKAWIRVWFTEPPEGVDYMASVFKYRGKNYLEYDLWNETKLRDRKVDELDRARAWLLREYSAIGDGPGSKLDTTLLVQELLKRRAEPTIKDFQETVRNRDAQLKRRDETISDLQRTQELHESQIKAYKAEQLDSQRLIADLRRNSERVAAIEPPRNMDTAVAERASKVHHLDEPTAGQRLAAGETPEQVFPELGATTNMDDPRYRAAVEAMDDVRKSERPECAHAIIYREKNEDKCTDCGAVVWPKPERAFKTPF